MSNDKRANRIKAALNTNIFVSGHLSTRGASYEILQCWQHGAFQLIISEEIVEEIIEKLFELGFSSEVIGQLVVSIYLLGLMTKGLYQVRAIREDPDDDMFLAAALEGESDFIVSFDSHLRALKYYHGIQIVSPSQFLKILRQQTAQSHGVLAN
jgi:putative PIN family toxin of toxin-antitoxin system